MTEQLPGGGCELFMLQHDGQDLTAEAHQQCPGTGAYLRPWGAAAVYYCAAPRRYGHTVRGRRSASPPAGPPRELVVRANREWLAAAKVRRDWFKRLLARRTDTLWRAFGGDGAPITFGTNRPRAYPTMAVALYQIAVHAEHGA